MRISTIIPVWNGEVYVAEAIQSVLNQTRPPDELIVVDDGSTDRTAEIVGGFRDVRLVRQPKVGAGPARNSGVSLATGDWVSFLDHDDLWLPEKLQVQIEAAIENPDASVVLGMLQNFISPELSAESRAHIACPAQPLQGYSASMILLRKDHFLRTGGWPATEREGVEWFVRARQTGLNFLEIPRILARRRLHETNRTRLAPVNNLDYVRIARESLVFRRAQAASQRASSPAV